MAPPEAPLPFDERQDFYRTYAWKKVRREVLDYYKHECQECLRRGRITTATLVHHDFPLEDYPSLGLEMFTPEGAPNLLPLCFACHERIETARGNRGPQEVKPLTEEWW